MSKGIYKITGLSASDLTYLNLKLSNIIPSTKNFFD